MIIFAIATLALLFALAALRAPIFVWTAALGVVGRGRVGAGCGPGSEPDADGFHHVTLTTAREDELGESLLRTLLAKDLRVRALSRTHPTLEDVFLAATRRSWDAVAPMPGVRRQETGDRGRGTGDRGQETGSQKQETEVRKAQSEVEGSVEGRSPGSAPEERKS